MSMPTAPALPAPDAASWTVAIGISACLHIGAAVALVLGLSAAPNAAPGPGPEIILLSVPATGMGQSAPPQRLQSDPAPERRLTALPEPDARALAPTATSLPALQPERATPATVPPQRLVPSSADQSAQTIRPIDTPAIPERVQPLSPLLPQPILPEASNTASRVTAEDRPRLAPVTALPPPPNTQRPLISEQSPARVQPVQEAATRSTPQVSPTAPGATTPRPPEDNARRAMLPPPDDTLERALRDRPNTFLSDRRAAPRPENLTQRSLTSAPPLTDAERQVAQMLDHLRSLPDIPCFAALATDGGQGNPVLEIFGPAQTGLDALRQRLEDVAGPMPDMLLRPMSQGQCATLDFVRQVERPIVSGIALRLQSRQIASGSPMAGQINVTNASMPVLLLIDATGQIQDLSRFLQPLGPTSYSFAIPIALQDAGAGARVETWNLLLALQSDLPLQTVSDLGGPQDSAKFLTQLRAEIASRALVPEIALTSIGLE
jgi:hypothetical protein